MCNVHTLMTDRFRLGLMQQSNRQDFLKLYHDPLVRRNLSQKILNVDFDQQFNSFLKHNQSKADWPKMWMVHDQSSTNVLGLISISLCFVVPEAIELGILLNSDQWNKGVGLECLQMVQHHLNEIHPDRPLSIKHGIENAAMGRLAEKLGFTAFDICEIKAQGIMKCWVKSPNPDGKWYGAPGSDGLEEGNH